MGNTNDPKPGANKVTNKDEQDVAVNTSTVQQGGYDEPSVPGKQETEVDKAKTQPKDPSSNKK